MAATLEISDKDVKLSDSYIKKALEGANGERTPLWQFEKMLKDDPRWDKTKQARNETYDLLAQVGKDWGFV
jgi:hypothetical protein